MHTSKPSRIPKYGIALVMAFMLVTTPRIIIGQASRCLGTDSTSAMMIAWAKKAVTGTDTARRTAWHLPVAPADSVMQVTDSATCASVVGAYNNDFPLADRSPTLRAYVIRVEGVYIVMSPDTRNGGEWVVYKVINAALAVLASYIG